MGKRTVFRIILVVLAPFFMSGSYYLLEKFFIERHFSHYTFILLAGGGLCGMLYAFFGYKYIKLVYPKRFDTKTKMLVVFLCFAAGYAVTYLFNLLVFSLECIFMALFHMDYHKNPEYIIEGEAYSFASPLLMVLLSAAAACIAYNALIEKNMISKHK